jgi:predicted transcriptional regulator
MVQVENLGKALAEARKKANISVITLSKWTGASRPTLYNWLRGKPISPVYIAKVKKALSRLESLSH